MGVQRLVINLSGLLWSTYEAVLKEFGRLFRRRYRGTGKGKQKGYIPWAYATMSFYLHCLNRGIKVWHACSTSQGRPVRRRLGDSNQRCQPNGISILFSLHLKGFHRKVILPVENLVLVAWKRMMSRYGAITYTNWESTFCLVAVGRRGAARYRTKEQTNSTMSTFG